MWRFRPLRYSLTVCVMFMAWGWIATSLVEYDGVLRLSSYRTAVWFYFGFPFMVVIGLGIGVFIASLIRKGKRKTAWGLLGIAGLVIYWTVEETLPKGRVGTIIGSDLAENITVYRLSSNDSFRDGVTTWGVISGTKEIMKEIERRKLLQLKGDELLYGFQNLSPADGLPERGPVYSRDEGTFYFHPAEGRIYFVWNPRSGK